MSKDRITPAALAALAGGDIDNFVAASTAGGIEAQEAAGQVHVVNSAILPKDIAPDRAEWEREGFVFGADADDLFVKVTLPDGWKKVATDHSMWSEILDVDGLPRVSIFYKAAFYDRRARATLHTVQHAAERLKERDERGKA